MDVVFTIVAKNYLSSACTLMNSIKSFHKNIDCLIILSDEWEYDEQGKSIQENIILAKELNIPEYEQMSFMYDVVEFATAVKPYAILNLLEKYDKVMYLDPDILVMDSLDEIWNALDKFNCVLTPHIVDLNISSNSRKESHILNRGVFNLGFIAVKRADEILDFMKWWANQLSTECIRNDILFVDQKWIDYLPIFCEKLFVLKSKCYNIADWNLQERKILAKNGCYYIENINEGKKIKFFHFSGIKQQDPQEYFNKIKFKGSNIEKEILSKLILEYELLLLKNGYENWHKCTYKYNMYSNGEMIHLLHRRLYRQFLLQGMRATNLFSINKNSFYAYLKRNHLLVKGMKINTQEANRENGNFFLQIKKEKISFGKKIIIKVVKMFVKIVGIKKYIAISNSIHSITDIDNQMFWWY